MEKTETSDGKLEEVIRDLSKQMSEIATLIQWAGADADASEENDAPTQAQEDRARQKRLEEAEVSLNHTIHLLGRCSKL